MAAIFISHSSRDDAVAADVRDWLATQGHRSLFLDFDPELGMASRWCFAEVTQASALGKVLLPVRIDDCTVDGVLSSRQVIDLREDRVDGLTRLRQGLSAAGVDPTELFDWDGSRPPYPGLLAFQEADAAAYFGRAREIGTGLDVLHRVRRLGSPGAVVVWSRVWESYPRPHDYKGLLSRPHRVVPCRLMPSEQVFRELVVRRVPSRDVLW